MRILVLGDFSAAQMRSSSLAERAPRGVDIDNLDEVLRRIAPRCSGADGTTFALASFDEFHPDYLYRELELFKALQQMRKRLQGPGHRRAGPGRVATTPWSGAAQPTSEHDADTFARLLGRAPAEPAPRAAAGNASGAIAAQSGGAARRTQDRYP
ncbi:MAG: type VI secretion system contractile sheath small subunit [Gammaproteobacteria bacterium]